MNYEELVHRLRLVVRRSKYDLLEEAAKAIDMCVFILAVGVSLHLGNISDVPGMGK